MTCQDQGLASAPALVDLSIAIHMPRVFFFLSFSLIYFLLQAFSQNLYGLIHIIAFVCFGKVNKLKLHNVRYHMFGTLFAYYQNMESFYLNDIRISYDLKYSTLE